MIIQEFADVIYSSINNKIFSKMPKKWNKL